MANTTETIRVKINAMDMAMRWAQPIIIAVLGWMIHGQIDLKDRMTKVESVGYSMQEAAIHEQRMQNAIADLRTELSQLKNRPPQWVLDRMQDFETRLRVLESR